MNDITIIAPVNPFQSGVGGTRNYVMNFIHTAQTENRIILYGFTSPENVDRRIHDNVVFHAVLVNDERKGRFRIPPSLRFIHRLMGMRKKILANDDVLHFHRFDYTLPFLFPNKRARIVVYFHGTASKGYLMGEGAKSKLKGLLYLFLEHLILPRVDRIITVSENDEKYYKEKYPKLSNKIITIPVPLNLEAFKIADNSRALRDMYGIAENESIVLYAGRFSKVKGIDFIIKAFAELNKEMPKSRLLLVGQGEEEENLKKMVAYLKVSNVRFMEPVPHEAMPDIMNCADVLVLASYTEGLPTVILEALACGVPVVSTDVGDMGQIITNEKIGFIIRSRDIKEMKELMNKAMEMSGSFKEERVAVVKRFSARKLSQEIIGINKELSNQN